MNIDFGYAPCKDLTAVIRSLTGKNGTLMTLILIML